MKRAFLVLSCALALGSQARAEDWPQFRGAKREGIWQETGIVAILPEKPRLAWATPLGSGFCGPAVAGGRVYVCDRILDPGGKKPENRWDLKNPSQGLERVLCLDAGSGKVRWQHSYQCRYQISYPSGPRATPTIDGSQVFTLGSMGDLLCLDAATGQVVWSRNFLRDFGTEMNAWGMAAAPLIDGQRVIAIVGGKNGAGVVAFNRDTGKDIWRAVESPDPGYSAPILIECQGTRQVLVWCPTGLYSLDPETGKVFWSVPANIKMGHSIASPIFEARRRLVFVTSFFDGPMMVQIGEDGKTARLLWQGKSRSELPRHTDGLHGLMATPAFHEGYLYGVCSYGHLRGLDPMTGKRLWETLRPTGEARWSTAFLVKHKDYFFLFNERGELIQARLSPAGYQELGRARLLEPTTPTGDRAVVWSHPAFADRKIIVRNDREIRCFDLSEDQGGNQP